MIAESLTWFLAVLLSTLLGMPLVAGLLRRIRRKQPLPEPSPAETTPPVVLRGGAWIGIFERFAVTLAILAGYPAGIGVVVAIKGLGRFPELLKARDVSELFIIGTLASMLWAGVIGLIGSAVLEALAAAA